MLKKHYIGVTMGDPAGIGPEIICKALNDEAVYRQCCPVVIGNREPLEQAIRCLGLPLSVHAVLDPADSVYDTNSVNVIEVPLDYQYEAGVLKSDNGRVAIEFMKKAYDLLVAKKISAIASAPCNKEAMKLAGSKFTGATELFAHFAGDLKTSTVVQQSGCYIFQMTTHLPLRSALEKLTVDFVFDYLLKSFQTLLHFGLSSPKIALSGLNPHAGEGGTLGTEEIDILIPSIEKAAKHLGADIAGPIPADSIYIKGQQGIYDAIIFLFHDTANIPIKLMELTHPSVVITSGLPFVRTTVAHGTAYDIAYCGIAGHQQMLNCIIAAAQITSRIDESR